jgi:hypothetical protein
VDKVTNNEGFKQALSSLPLTQQRQIGAKFIVNVLDLTDGMCARHIQDIAERSDLTVDELENAYRSVHSVYVVTHPRSDLSELDYGKQAAHFVAEACMACLAPTYEEYRTHHLAEKVAGYCQMARICSSIRHDQETPSFKEAEEALKKELNAQHRILNEYLESLS